MTPHEAAERRFSLRLGALCALIGTLIFGATGAFHGDLPTDTTVATLRYVADRPYWRAIHLGGIVGALLWVAAFVSFARTLAPGAAAVVGRLAVVSIVIGATIFTLDYTIDGVGLKGVADNWAAAAASDQATLVAMTDAIFAILGGTFRLYMAFLLGLPFVLAGVALALDRAYPAWFGWAGAVTGAGPLIAGLSGFVGLSLIPEWLVFAVFLGIEQLWLLGLAYLLWRRANAPTPRHNATPAPQPHPA